MLKKIAIAEVRPGMYIVDSGLSWLEFPYLYMKEGMISSAAAIQSIVVEGYTEAVIDTELSVGLGAGNEGEEAISRELQALPEFFPPLPQLLVGQEMDTAQLLYKNSVRYAKALLEDIRVGKAVDIATSEQLVEEIIGSVTRNCDAMVGLSKLRVYDEYTFTHSVNVAVLTVVFARFLGKADDELKAYGMAGLFHDVGKQLIPDAVLNKPGKLTEEEFAVMKQHPLLGFKHMCQHPSGQKTLEHVIMRGMVEHHEKFNGLGYPRGLSGSSISEVGRIIAVADVYDALSSRRVYKAPMPAHKALGLMYSMRGKEFYPGYVERFIKCLGIYPVGTTVRLNTGHIAVVSASNPKAPMQPMVMVVSGPAGKIRPRTLDLADQLKLRIESTIDPATVDIDPQAILEKAV